MVAFFAHGYQQTHTLRWIVIKSNYFTSQMNLQAVGSKLAQNFEELIFIVCNIAIATALHLFILSSLHLNVNRSHCIDSVRMEGHRPPWIRSHQTHCNYDTNHFMLLIVFTCLSHLVHLSSITIWLFGQRFENFPSTQKSCLSWKIIFGMNSFVQQNFNRCEDYFTIANTNWHCNWKQ